MKIEKINDNQIKCILNKTDLDSRNLKISELAYGSDKANSLFKEMTETASKKFGFSIGDSPLMIEAVPMPNDSVTLILTKVNDPEELDTRFSKFTPSKEDFEDAMNIEKQIKQDKANKATEILNMLNSLKEALSDNPDLVKANAKSLALAGTKSTDGQENALAKNPPLESNLIMIYSFDSIEKLIQLAKTLAGKNYSGTNSVYRHNNLYYLVLEKSKHTAAEFNQICNIVCEFGNRTQFNGDSASYIDEHYEPILKSNALQDLIEI